MPCHKAEPFSKNKSDPASETKMKINRHVIRRPRVDVVHRESSSTLSTQYPQQAGTLNYFANGKRVTPTGIPRNRTIRGKSCESSEECGTALRLVYAWALFLDIKRPVMVIGSDLAEEPGD